MKDQIERHDTNRMNELIRRQWLMECVNEGWIKFDTEKDKNTFTHLVRDIAPTALTEDYVLEWAQKRNMAIVSKGLYLEMIKRWSAVEHSEQKESCSVCEGLEDGDTLYAYSDWDGGIGFDYIHNIKYCPVCGRKLNRIGGEDD